jgi:hypothetical protein
LWETLEKIEEEKELRETKREKSKTKKFNQQVKSNAGIFSFTDKKSKLMCHNVHNQIYEWRYGVACTKK